MKNICEKTGESFLELDGESLTTRGLAEAARSSRKIKLAKKSRMKIKESRKFIEELIDSGEAIYGVNTGIGELANVKLSEDKMKEFQRYLIYSHAGGYGEPVSIGATRAAIFSRINTLAKGMSGVRLEVVEKIIEILNAGITPVMYPASVGACGDLAPLSQAMLVPMGEGEAFHEGEKIPASEALERAGIEPIEYEARDGLAVINGSQLTTGLGALEIEDATKIIKTAEIAGAMSLEALCGLMKPFSEELLKARGFEGGVESASNIRKITEGSEILKAAAESGRVQDAYSLRSMAQVTGSVRDALKYAKEQIETEMNGAADNPLFIPGEGYFTGANFQGTPIAFPLETLGTAVTTLCVLSERRLNRLINPDLSNGLPGFLIEESGMYSGIMIPQYTAASLIAENRVYCNPSANGSIPVSADQEDFVSMGTVTAIKTQKIIDNAFAVLAIELLGAAQALELRMKKDDLKPGKGTMAAYRVVRKYVEFLDEDRPLYRDIEKLKEVVESDEIIEKVEEEIGNL